MKGFFFVPLPQRIEDLTSIIIVKLLFLVGNSCRDIVHYQLYFFYSMLYCLNLAQHTSVCLNNQYTMIQSLTISLTHTVYKLTNYESKYLLCSQVLFSNIDISVWALKKKWYINKFQVSKTGHFCSVHYIDLSKFGGIFTY